MTETRAQQQGAAEEKLPAQYVNYLFFKLDPVWRRLDEEERERDKKEFLGAVEEHGQEMLLRSSRSWASARTQTSCSGGSATTSTPSTG